MTYVDGWVTPVPTANLEDYRQQSKAVALAFKKHGALSYVVCWGDDVPDGKVTSFPMAVQCREDETVVFSWMTWPSREARDRGLKTVMADAPFDLDAHPQLFDAKRLIRGGFSAIIDV